MTYHVLIRFGEWEKILDEPEPGDYRHVSRAHWRYARAPVRELYGELLLKADRVTKALDAFQASLERTPNRRNALAGVEMALAAMESQ